MTRATIRRLVCMLTVAGALCAPATVALAQAPTPTPPPGIGAKLLQGPAGNIDDPRAHDYIVDHLAPGTTISRDVGFSNGEAQPVDLTFYAASAHIGDGSFKVGDGHATNDLTSWISFSPASGTVQPGQTLPVTVTIAVPADATAGERYAAALAEHASPPAANGGVVTVGRVGIRLYLSVGPGGAPRTAFNIDSMTAERDAEGNPLVSARVHNTGDRAIDLSGKLELTNGPNSLSAGPFAVNTVATLAPGESGPVTIALDPALPDGPWDAHITLVSGLTTEVGTARLTFPAADGASAPPVIVTGVDGLRASNVVVAIAIALAAFLAAGWMRSRRLGRARHLAL
jgi:hypothetical protein